MSDKPLNLDGVLEESSKNKKPASDRHLTERKSIALNFSDLRRPYATALSHWKKHALATPIVWLVLDKLGEQKEGPAETVMNVNGAEFASIMLEELRKVRK
ncbi:hypothetical protein HYG89_11695 [Acinetobacter sp. SwsAc5]|uniref:hypothetical protein n=1 Tax=Acinetobacter sp. SwsAc5 TaxID=2749438 RepID=UPI0015BDD20B|nr:hypothetical protein [Acinetobacter sp. SwsAc5]NWK53196.1 hypothetical protein [Acinetobacter sp. SwsAc5]